MFGFIEYNWSRLFLKRMDQDPNWPTVDSAAGARDPADNCPVEVTARSAPLAEA